MSDALPLPSTMTVFSLSTVIRLAVPRSLMSTFSNLTPISSVITVPPVRIAISFSISFLRSPKPGALIAHTFKVPLNLFTTRVANASPSTSSAIITSGLPPFATFSNNGSMSFMLEIFFSCSRIYASSITASIRSASVTK